MKEIIEIQGFKCPYCGFKNTNKSNMLKHMNRCRKNDEYTQHCINCPNLEQDWLIRKFYNGKSICCYSEAECPYMHHDVSEINKKIEEHVIKMKRYGYDVSQRLKELKGGA